MGNELHDSGSGRFANKGREKTDRKGTVRVSPKDGGKHKNPAIAGIVTALEGMVNEKEDFNVAEYYADAVSQTTDLFRKTQQNRAR
jgi:hypothetical protein